MRIVVYEAKKVFSMPALWSFFLLSFALNILFIIGKDYEREYFNMQSAFRADENDNVFAGYDTKLLAAFYANVVKESPVAVDWVNKKYTLLQPRAEHLAECGAALDFYAGDATYESHQFLFGSLMRAMLVESSVCAMFVMLYLMGYEQMNCTDAQVCACRIGRWLWVQKMIAAILSAVFLYFLLTGITLIFYLELWNYSGVWNESVSSRFNYFTDLLYIRLFLTWHDFTVGGYLAAVLLLGAVLVIVFGLMSAVCAMVFRNVYGAALVLAVILFGGMGLESLFSQCKAWVLYFIATMQPAAVLFSVNVWFTEAGISTFLPWQETISAALNLMGCSIAVIISWRRFRRREMWQIWNKSVSAGG
ncbi:MAG: hypothetical protein K2M91_05905 [Lachnospiraceae bacterium]|nr:hypothetical protein [Lachnospiraceae bacterium]